MYKLQLAIFCLKKIYKEENYEIMDYHFRYSIRNSMMHKDPCSNWNIEGVYHPVHWNAAIKVGKFQRFITNPSENQNLISNLVY